MPLDSWMAMFEHLYFQTQNHEKSDLQILARLVEQVGAIAKFCFKKPDLDRMCKYMARTFAWYCALCIRLGRRRMDDRIWARFPGVCHYCAQKPCECGVQKGPVDPSYLERLARDNAHLRPRNVSQWQDLLREIYLKRNIATASVDGFHNLSGELPFPVPDMSSLFQFKLAFAFGRLAEEVGELAEVIRLRYFMVDEVDEELADFFAWLLGMANILADAAPELKNFRLSDVAWQYYPDRCLVCGKDRCGCTTYPVKDVIAIAGVEVAREIDMLTGVGSTKAWLSLCEVAARHPECIKRSLPISFIFFDVNDFKAINDDSEGGHQQGNAVLTEIGELLSRHTREDGQAFRLGGDEFGLLLAPCDSVCAFERTEAIKTDVESRAFRNVTGGESLSTSLAAGVATLEREATIGGDTLKELAHEADQQLYKDKSPPE